MDVYLAHNYSNYRLKIFFYFIFQTPDIYQITISHIPFERKSYTILSLIPGIYGYNKTLRVIRSFQFHAIDYPCRSRD